MKKEDVTSGSIWLNCVFKYTTWDSSTSLKRDQETPSYHLFDHSDQKDVCKLGEWSLNTY